MPAAAQSCTGSSARHARRQQGTHPSVDMTKVVMVRSARLHRSRLGSKRVLLFASNHPTCIACDQWSVSPRKPRKYDRAECGGGLKRAAELLLSILRITRDQYLQQPRLGPAGTLTGATHSFSLRGAPNQAFQASRVPGQGQEGGGAKHLNVIESKCYPPSSATKAWCGAGGCTGTGAISAAKSASTSEVATPSLSQQGILE